MRILIVGLNFYPEPTGIGKYTGELAAFLGSRGHEVHVITTPPYYPHWRVQMGYHAGRYRRQTWRNVDIWRCPVWVPSRPTGFTRLIHIATFVLSSLPVLAGQVGWKPDVIVCVAPALANAPFVLALARVCRSKTWLHLQDFELDIAHNLGLFPAWKPMLALVAWIERTLLNQFGRISTIAKAMSARLHAKGLDWEKIVLLPNWVDTGRIYPLNSNNPIRADLDLPPDHLVVLYAGAMGRKQGLDTLLEAARFLEGQPCIQFVLCGDGVARSGLEAAADDLPNVRFLPVQPADKLNQLLNAADIHVLIQKAEAADLVMPSKLSGMLASGRPVIATARRDTEVGRVVSQVGVLVPPEDPEALALEISSLARSPARRRKLGKKGRAYILENWDASLILRRFEQQLRQLGQRRRAASYAVNRDRQPSMNGQVGFE